MPWGFAATAVAGAGASIYGAREQARGAERGGSAAANETARQFDLTRGDTAERRNIGDQAIRTLGSVYGYAPVGAPGAMDDRVAGGKALRPSEVRHLLAQRPGTTIDDLLRIGVLEPGAKTSDIAKLMTDFGWTPEDIQRLQQGRFSPIKPPTGASGAAPGGAAGPDYSAFFRSPDYEFRRDEGLRGIENRFSAGGGARSGNALRALADFNSNLAGGEYGNWFNRQATLAGIGQAATDTSANAGISTGRSLADIYRGTAGAIGDARASGISGVNDALQGGASNLMLWQLLNKQPAGGVQPNAWNQLGMYRGGGVGFA